MDDISRCNAVIFAASAVYICQNQSISVILKVKHFIDVHARDYTLKVKRQHVIRVSFILCSNIYIQLCIKACANQMEVAVL